jgi:phosphatidate phosphatase LPIN
VRSLSGPVSKTWNSINPATLSGAIDVIVIEHEDGEYFSHRRNIKESLFLTFTRKPGLLALPRQIRKILSASSVRKESRVQSQWSQARLFYEIG